LGGTIGFFATGIPILLLSILWPSIGELLMNPILFMVLCMAGVFIGNSIEKKGKISTGDVKKAIKEGVVFTFGWFTIWFGIGLVFFLIVFILKLMNSMPRNY
jgi:uncharacterized membrane protein